MKDFIELFLINAQEKLLTPEILTVCLVFAVPTLMIFAVIKMFEAGHRP